MLTIDLPGLTLTFSGGTCLAKAYQLLERMSEDIDLRLVIDDQQLLSRSAARRALSQLKQSLADAFRSADFDLPDDQIRARNENHFISFDLRYASRYPPDAALRTQVRVEFMAIPPLRPTRPLTIQPLIDRLTQRVTAAPATLACLSIDETYCEKIISYLRRSTEHLAGLDNSQYEDRLARHVYDTHQIATLHYRDPNARPPQDLFDEILAGDLERYGNRIDGLRLDPAGTLRQTLDEIPRRGDFREHYDRFVAELVYGDQRPTFDQAFATFWTGAEQALVGYGHQVVKAETKRS